MFLVLRRTLVAFVWTLPILLIVGVVGVLPAVGLMAFERSRFVDQLVEISTIEASPPRTDRPLEADGRPIVEILGERHDVYDAERERRLAREHMALVFRWGAVLCFGLVFFLAQAALASVVDRGLSDRWSLHAYRGALTGLRRATGSALLMAAAFVVGFGVTIAWLFPGAGAILPVVLLCMGLAALYVLVPARAVETDSFRASAARSAELTKGSRVWLFLLWAVVVVLWLMTMMLLSTVIPSRPLDGPRSEQILFAIATAGVVFPGLAATISTVAHHRLREMREAPTKLEAMVEQFS